MYQFGLATVLCAALAATASADERPEAERKLLEELASSESGIRVSARDHFGRIVALDVAVDLDDIRDRQLKPVTPADLALVFRKVRGFASLESLHLAGVGTGFDDTSAAELTKLPKLKSLSYAVGHKDKPGTLAAFLKAAAGVKRLESLELSLSDAELDAADLAELAKLQNLTTLRYAARSGKEKPKPLAAILRTAAGLKSLDALHLSLINADIDDAAVAELGKMSKLRTLSYTSCAEVVESDFPDAPARIKREPKPLGTVVRAVASLESLEQLAIHTEGMTAEDARGLKACKKLKGLILEGHRLPHTVLDELANAFGLEDVYTKTNQSIRLPIRGYFFTPDSDIDGGALREMIPFDPKEGDDRLTRLMKLRFQAALEGLRLRTSEFLAGRGTLAALIEETLALKQSGLELAPTPEAKRAFLRVVLDVARSMEMINRRRYETGKINGQDYFQSRRFRLDLEIELAQLAKKPAPPKP